MHLEVQPEHAGKSEASQVPEVEKSLKLSPLPAFDGDNHGNVEALGRWLAKLEKHTELLRWLKHTKLLQFELHLTGCAKHVYKLLSSSVKSSFEEASQALHEWLYPVESEALVSAQLKRRKQLSSETVDEFVQDVEKLFEWCNGRKRGMDESSKELLKRDVFVQGLLLKSLHQARAEEQQEHQLSRMHPHLGQPLSLRLLQTIRHRVLLQQNHRKRKNLSVTQREIPSVLSVGQPHTSGVNGL